MKLLKRFPKARTILEPGCGTGYFTRWFGIQRLRSVGADLSLSMLHEAKKSGGNYLQADAFDLPFQAKSFDLVALITTLEFLPDPFLALKEALRIARQGLILGVLNADSRLGQQYKRDGGVIWEAARLFTLVDIKRFIFKAAGKNAKIFWRTTLWPYWPGALPLPNGGFIGLAVEL